MIFPVSAPASDAPLRTWSRRVSELAWRLGLPDSPRIYNGLTLIKVLLPHSGVKGFEDSRVTLRVPRFSLFLSLDPGIYLNLFLPGRDRLRRLLH